MIIIIVAVALLLTIMFFCIPHLLLIGVMGFLGWGIARILKRKVMAKTIVAMCLLVSLQTVFTETLPIINEVYEDTDAIKKDIIEEREEIKKFSVTRKIENSIEDIVDKEDKGILEKTLEFLTKMPNDKKEE